MFNVFDPSRREISGPYNAIRMEGVVDDHRKVVYLFMDIHLDTRNQTECANVHSQDFNRFLAESFHELNGSERMYDFFFESLVGDFKIDPKMRADATAQQGPGQPRFKYITQVLKLLRSTVKYDATGDKIGMSDIFKNVRLHYLDIREILNYILGSLFRLPILFSVYNIDMGPQIYEELEHICDIANNLIKIYQDLSKNPHATLDYDPEYLAFAKNIHKLLNGYKHEDVRRVLTKKVKYYFAELQILVEMIKDFITRLKTNQPLLDDITPAFPRDNIISSGIPLDQRTKLVGDTVVAKSELSTQALYVGMGITDCYLLRRLLDKDYVTNAIVYTGGSHTINYINVLFRDFGFRITHASSYGTKTIANLNHIIKERLIKGEIITDLLIRKTGTQCSDLTGFPKRFM